MLKGFVSGEEKDIKRIPMKGRNLFLWPYTSTWGVDGSGQNRTVYNSAITRSSVIKLKPNTQYTLSAKAAGSNDIYCRIAIFDENPKIGSVSTHYYYSSGDGSTTFMTGADEEWGIVVQNSAVPVDIDLKRMLNEGSTALPYEPYGYQEGWEVRDNQDRLIWGREDELQTATGTLSFKGYALPVKVKSLLGNAVQNGTPAPDNIIMPEMCGVRTGNLAQSVEQGGITNVGEKTTASNRIRVKADVSPNTTYTFASNKPISIISGFTGETFAHSIISPAGFPTQYTFTTGEDDTVVYVTLRNEDGTTIRPADLSDTMLNLGSTALPYEPYGWKVPFDNHGENLFDKVFTSGYHLSTNGNPTAYTNDARCATLEPIDVSGVSAVTFSFTNTLRTDTKKYMYSLFDGSTLVTRVSNLESGSTIDASQGDKLYLCVYSSLTSVNAAETTTDTMLNPGSTPKPYSPYLNEAIPVYLGEVPTVRRVRKLVLDGTESWTRNDPNMYIQPSDILRSSAIVCSHYKDYNDYTVDLSVTTNRGSKTTIWFNDSEFTTTNQWKQFLASEYAAGTPVTVWYVLAEPTTGIVNEPLCKIGDYADELTTIQVHGLSAPLYGIGDYKDTLNLSTGVVTRKIKKLVLTGGDDENWSVVTISANNCIFRLDLSEYPLSGVAPISTHYTGSTADLWVNVADGEATTSIRNLNAVAIHHIGLSGVTDWKAFLAAQYQAGTPVTIWYVLNTPETETITVPTGMTGEIEGYLIQVSTPTPTNRSVPKWNGVEETGGTYAVTVYTPPEIPTTTGENTLTVDTSLAPSSLTIKGHIKELT